jgi:hypothetical protein
MVNEIANFRLLKLLDFVLSCCRGFGFPLSDCLLPCQMRLMNNQMLEWKCVHLPFQQSVLTYSHDLP